MKSCFIPAFSLWFVITDKLEFFRFFLPLDTFTFLCQMFPIHSHRIFRSPREYFICHAPKTYLLNAYFFYLFNVYFFTFLLVVFFKHNILPYKITFQKTRFEQFLSKTIEHTSYDVMSWIILCLRFKHYTCYSRLFSHKLRLRIFDVIKLLTSRL